MPRSYRSPKTAVRKSPIHGRGLFATRPIARGEVVAIKGGHVLGPAAFRRVKHRVAESYIQIGDRFHLGAASRREVARNKLYLNHSCDPNVGFRGEITLVAMRAIAAGEELTYDWAMEENARALTRCRCASVRCRGWLTGRDWLRPELQRRYRGFFSAYLAEKIARPARRRPRDSGRSRR